MCLKRLAPWKIWLVCLAGALADPASALAGWMGFRNDTNLTLVVQEVIVVNRVPRAGKPQKMSNGDVIRDTQVAPTGQRQFLIFDSRNPRQPIYTGSFACPKANENVLYSIRSDGKGGIVVEAGTSAAQVSPKR